jgi:transcriptional regulator with XRE-family HTH domain
MSANTRFEDWEAEQLQDPEFRAAAEDLEPAYQVARLRIARGLTQEQLAEMVGTKQPSIARLESGKMEPRLSFLRRVVEALDGKMEVQIVPREETPAGEQSA